MIIANNKFATIFSRFGSFKLCLIFFVNDISCYCYLSVFSPNAGKYRPKKSPYLGTFQAVCVPQNTFLEDLRVDLKTRNFRTRRQPWCLQEKMIIS